LWLTEWIGNNGWLLFVVDLHWGPLGIMSEDGGGGGSGGLQSESKY